jgi:pimeloyl-ACP methyl ester carboxylesterase
VSRAVAALFLLCLASAAGAASSALAAAPGSRPAAKAATRTVSVDGIKLGYRVVGRGRPVVLIQGLSGTMDAWDPKWVDALAAQGRRVVLLDNEGMGRSELRPGPLSIRRMGDDTAGLIRKLRLRRADVIGWSMGGTIAQSLAVRHPKLVRRLVLMATAPGDGTATMPTGRALASLVDRSSGVATAGAFLFPPGREAAQGRYIANLATRRGFAPLGPRTTIGLQTAATGLWLFGRDPAGKRVRSLRQRVLVGGGALDELLPVANQRRLAKIIPRAKLVVYRDAAHGFFLQKRIKFLSRIDRHLG